MWGKESFFQEVSFLHEKTYPPQFRFFFGTRGAKKKLGKKKRRFMGAAQTRKLLKKLDQNFHAWVQCEHNAFDD